MTITIPRRALVAVLASLAAAAVLVPLSGALAAHGGALTTGTLDGRQEVANGATNQRIVGDPDGSGEAYVFSTGGDVVCYVLEVAKIGTATAAHIHRGAAGQNGPVVVNLSPPADGDAAGCVSTGDVALATDITLNRPQDFYVNIHNAEFPGGALRAQLGE
jgi:hypothetical protein